MLWQHAATALVWVLALNRWLAENQPQVQAEPQWTPVVTQDGQVIQ